ncbi:MAG: hypothetical protein SXQ77_00895, partial [Halobacteria archaeon]|nr:hypothetical protein [Halobacteria archaeon]
MILLVSVPFPSPEKSKLIARTELRRKRRAVTEDDRKMVGILIGGLGFLVFFLAVTVFAYLGGSRIRTGEIENPLSVASTVVAGVWAFVLFISAFRTITKTGEIDEADGMLTNTAYPDVLGGVILAEFVTIALVSVVPAILGS